MCQIGLFTAFIAVLSLLSIPMPGGVPVTLQTFAISFSAVILGMRKAAMTSIIYVLLGTVGVPVFAGFQGGVHVLAGPTGGFLISLPIMALIVGFAAKRSSSFVLAIALAFGSIVNLALGSLQFAFVTRVSLHTAFTLAFAPFILIEGLKMIVVLISAPALRNQLRKARILQEDNNYE